MIITHQYGLQASLKNNNNKRMSEPLFLPFLGVYLTLQTNKNTVSEEIL